ncbi:TatD family hydrolase [Acidithiobacillus sp. AMEEHan]|uniref:TatD family hydrolase n=1 Tax=Acidithiobacillus sp. AMEEHan TaxID=2994951 RepID=UPI0027E4E283|nr:TatD family hydrolase [Acidithiobacillus sp. AMEEHan]
MLIDSHCHLDHEDFAQDRAEVLARSRAAGVRAWVVPAYSPRCWSRLDSLRAGERGVVAAFGVHPCFLADLRVGDWERLEALLGNAAAVGEVGLDRGTGAADLAQQLPILERQLAIARAHGLPVILHARKTTEELLQLLRRHRPVAGVLHSFSGSFEQAQKAIDLGLSLGFGGAITHPRAQRLRRVLAALPQDAIVLETDAPFQAPHAQLGERNEPAFLTEILTVAAELRQESAEQLAEICTANTLRVFPRLEKQHVR